VIDLRPHHLEIVLQILGEYVPECQVYTFGSRARRTAKPHSDLDLAVRGQGPVAPERLGRLEEAFEESDLPMRVDVVDWHTITRRFREIIDLKALGYG
jgi:type I restriction enzyme S subunit